MITRWLTRHWEWVGGNIHWYITPEELPLLVISANMNVRHYLPWEHTVSDLTFASLLPEKETEGAEGELGSMDRLSPRATHHCCQVETASHQRFHRSALYGCNNCSVIGGCFLLWSGCRPFGVSPPTQAPFKMLHVWTYCHARTCRAAVWHSPHLRSDWMNDDMLCSTVCDLVTFPLFLT